MSVQKSKAPAKQERKTEKTANAGASKSPVIFLFGKRNFYLMFIGLALIVLGFLFMTGARVSDPNVFDRSEIYSFRRITLAPILIIAGFIIEVFAIMLKPKGDAAGAK